MPKELAQAYTKKAGAMGPSMNRNLLINLILKKHVDEEVSASEALKILGGVPR